MDVSSIGRVRRKTASYSPISLTVPSSYLFSGAVQPYTLGNIVLSGVPSRPVPDGALIYLDFERNVYYWDGSQKSISSMTDNGDGTYQFDLLSGLEIENLSGFAEVTMPNSGATASLNIVSFTNASGQRFEVEHDASGLVRIYDSATAAYAVFGAENNNAKAGYGDRFRFGWSYTPGQPKLLVARNSANGSSGSALDISNPFDRVGIGYRRAGGVGSGVFAGVIHKICIWSAPRTENEVRRDIENAAPNIGVFFLGDSVFNGAAVRNDFNDLIKSRGQYFFTGQQSTGGLSLREIANDFVLNRQRHYNKTIVIFDLGMNTQDNNLSALKDLVAVIPHERWVYVQSNPVDATGAGNRAAWDADDGAIAAYCGASHYCETLSVMQANGDGGATDNTDIANDVWPSSLRTDSVHPNAAGQAILAQAIYGHLIKRGWLAYTVTMTIAGGGTLSVDGNTNATVTGDGTATLRVSGGLQDVNAELASLAIAGSSAGSHALTISFYDTVKDRIKTKQAMITVT